MVLVRAVRKIRDPAVGPKTIFVTTGTWSGKTGIALKILIGYDGSDTADKALKDLARAGLPAKAEVIILVAIPPMIPQDYLAAEGYAIQWYSQAYTVAVRNSRTESHAKSQAKAAMQRLKKQFPGWKISLESSLENPSHAILDRSDAWKPDLIVLGSHGWNPIGKMLIGSVAEKVMKHARGSVRIGKAGRAGITGPPRILIGFDGSKESLLAVDCAADRQWPKGAKVRVVAVSEFQLRLEQIALAVNQVSPLKYTPDGPWSWMEARLAKAKDKLSQPGVLVETAIITGDPRHVLLGEAKKFRADVIFLGNRGLSGMKRFMLGSVSAAVASHSTCSIEIVRGINGRK